MHACPECRGYRLRCSYELDGGGAVFTTGSIGWASALPSNGYDNTVAKITANVIRRFAEADPFVVPPPLLVDAKL